MRRGSGSEWIWGRRDCAVFVGGVLGIRISDYFARSGEICGAMRGCV